MKSIKRRDVQRKGGRKRETPKRGEIQTEMRDTQTGKGRRRESRQKKYRQKCETHRQGNGKKREGSADK